MKVNGKPIFVITTHKNIIVEKTIKGLSFPEEVPVYASFDYRDVIGIAKLWYFQGKIFANISLLIPAKGYPAIGYIPGGKVFCLSINVTQNKDPDIKMIGV